MEGFSKGNGYGAVGKKKAQAIVEKSKDFQTQFSKVLYPSHRSYFGFGLGTTKVYAVFLSSRGAHTGVY